MSTCPPHPGVVLLEGPLALFGSHFKARNRARNLEKGHNYFSFPVFCSCGALSRRRPILKTRTAPFRKRHERSVALVESGSGHP